ncbi:MAG TPA: MoaD/ThiS family protein [Caulobacteraceae bacterium]|jgi:molybdopterin converting factor small subunit
MSVRVVFLGALAERFGARERLVEAPGEGITLEELKARAAGGQEHLLAALAPPVRAAVDREIAAGDARVRPGQEVAFFPLFSGG